MLRQVTEKKKHNKTIFIVMAIFISILVAQNVFYTLLLDGKLSRELSSFWGIMLFASLAALSYGLGWYILSHFVGQTGVQVKAKSRYFNLMYKAIRGIFYLTAVILAIIIFQMALNLQYNVILSVVAMASSTILAAIIMSILSYRFLSWFRSKHDLSIFLYGLAFAITAIGAGMMSIANTVAFLVDGPPTREEPSSSSVEDFTEATTKGSARSELFQITLMPYRLTFGLYWIGTVLLLHHYSKSFGRLKFWTVVSLPLVFFIISNLLFSTSRIANSLALDVILSLTFPALAILYAATFFTMARTMNRTRNNTLAAHYLIISGYGVILLLATTSSSPHFVDYEQNPYPPFAIAPWSFLGFAVYLFSIGYYFSAISLSQDIRLRKAIRHIATGDAKFIGNIGLAQMEGETMSKIVQLAREHEEMLKKQTGIGQSLSEEDIKRYVDNVLQEVKEPHSDNQL